MDSLNSQKKYGFTLAEVLITLGIVGVVSALTLPTLINNFRAKALETSFKKADAVLTRAMQTTMFEHGLTRFYDFGQYCKGNYCSETKASDYDDIQATWREQFNGIVREVDLQNIRSGKYKMFNFFGESARFDYATYFVDFDGSRKGFILKDGMLVSEIYFTSNNASEIGSTYHKWTIIPYVFFDTNGPAKGPNRIGYDIFYYSQMTGYPITRCAPLEDVQSACYFSARKDQNPYDSSIGYWKSLYKSKNYWEKLKNNK